MSSSSSSSMSSHGSISPIFVSFHSVCSVMSVFVTPKDFKTSVCFTVGGDGPYEINSKAQNNRTRTLDTPVGLVRTYYSCFVICMCVLGAMSQRLLSAVNSACFMRWIPFWNTVLLHLRWIFTDTVYLCMCGGS